MADRPGALTGDPRYQAGQAQASALLAFGQVVTAGRTASARSSGSSPRITRADRKIAWRSDRTLRVMDRRRTAAHVASRRGFACEPLPLARRMISCRRCRGHSSRPQQSLKGYAGDAPPIITMPTRCRTKSTSPVPAADDQFQCDDDRKRCQSNSTQPHPAFGFSSNASWLTFDTPLAKGERADAGALDDPRQRQSVGEISPATARARRRGLSGRIHHGRVAERRATICTIPANTNSHSQQRFGEMRPSAARTGEYASHTNSDAHYRYDPQPSPGARPVSLRRPS